MYMCIHEGVGEGEQACVHMCEGVCELACKGTGVVPEGIPRGWWQLFPSGRGPGGPGGRDRGELF